MTTSSSLSRQDQPVSLKTYFPWLLSLVVISIAVIDWGGSQSWQIAGLSIYQVFPLFGLLAFSVMWSQYIVSHLKGDFLKGIRTRTYFKITGYIVLIAIIFHPSLLITQRYIDGYGLPPESYLTYVAQASRFAVLVGSFSFFIFISFELRRFFSKRSWWKYVEYAVDVAMLAILYHSLTLGTQLHEVWLRTIWYFYGITLIYVLFRKYQKKLKGKQAA